MRYPDGGGLSAAGRARRERVRLAAAAMYEHDIKPVQVAHELRVSTKSAYQWRRRWRAGRHHGAGVQGRGRGGVPADLRRSWPGCALSWTKGQPCTAGLRISGGRWSG